MEIETHNEDGSKHSQRVYANGWTPLVIGSVPGIAPRDLKSNFLLYWLFWSEGSRRPSWRGCWTSPPRPPARPPSPPPPHPPSTPALRKAVGGQRTALSIRETNRDGKDSDVRLWRMLRERLLGNRETIGGKSWNLENQEIWKSGHSSTQHSQTPKLHRAALEFYPGLFLHNIIPKTKWGNSFAGDNHVNLIYNRSVVLDNKIWFQLKLSEGDSLVIYLLFCGFSHPRHRCFVSKPGLFVCKQPNTSNSWSKTNAVEIMCNTSDDSTNLLVI